MTCTECRRTLETVNREGITFQVCWPCHGVWFESAELKAYERRHQKYHLFELFHTLQTSAKILSLCPGCGQPTFVLDDLIGTRTGHCWRCEGYWVGKMQNPTRRFISTLWGRLWHEWAQPASLLRQLEHDRVFGSD